MLGNDYFYAMKTTPITNTAGVILAGGKSRRFGSNKALADIDGCPMIEHGAALLNDLFTERLLVTNTPDYYHFLNWPVTPDIFPGAGPLAGIHAALKKINCSRAFITACDMPLINSRLIQFLCGTPGDWDIIVPWLDRGPEPLYGVYRKSCLEVIENNLLNDQRKIRLIFDQLKIRKVSLDEITPHISDLTTFVNINRLSDLAKLPKNSDGRYSNQQSEHPPC